LRAIEHKLSYITIEQDEVGGTVAKYPRQKLVMTSPVEFPMYGKFKSTELSKEKLLAFWEKVLHRADFTIRSGEKVDNIQRDADGVYTVTTSKATYRARAVVLALGRTGTPRKLGVKGEDLPKVMYRLIEADHYINKKILVVGGGDSAVEAAMGLSHQKGNEVTLSYRQEQFSRIKERNVQRLAECTRSGRLKVALSSNVKEIREGSVLLEAKGAIQEIPNDYVWVFAGGTPPYDFLKKIGVQFGARDLTSEVGEEAKQEAAFKKQSSPAPAADTPDVESAVARLGVPGEELAKVAYSLPQPLACSDKDILVVGSGDAAIRTALMLAHARRNRVTLSYRGDQFQRAAMRLRLLLDAAEKEGALRVLRNSEVMTITPDSVVLNVAGNPAEIPNDLIFILIGVELPQEMKYSMGIGMAQSALAT
jgi:thioredoxin reductase